MNILATILVSALVSATAFLGSSVVPETYDSAIFEHDDYLCRMFPNASWCADGVFFGATSFPTSLDVFTNPSGTDSVATVSHSGQHGNANDAIEALEAKLGITASTPISGTVLAGNGVGSSIWTTYATTTNLTATGLRSEEHT